MTHRSLLKVFFAAGVVSIGLSAAIVLRFARTIVTPPRRLDLELRIVDIDRVHRRIVLNDCPAARLPGKFGLWFQHESGYLRFGNIISVERGRVERELLDVVSGTPRKGMHARDSGWFFTAPWELDVPWTNEVVPGPAGNLPAWHFQPAGAPADWVIHVHGRTAGRGEALRGVRAATSAGWQSLVVSYRNDSGHSSEDGRYGLGSTEWEDVRAAMRFASERGAQRIVLFGWSMGGMIALRAAAEAVGAEAVAADEPQPVGLILESPVLSWPSVIQHHAALVRLPKVFGYLVTELLQSRLAPLLTGMSHPLNWRQLDGGNLAAKFGAPVLMLHSAADGYVPVEPARRLAQDLPGAVEYVEFADAGHVRLWNVDSDRWESLIADWLRRR